MRTRKSRQAPAKSVVQNETDPNLVAGMGPVMDIPASPAPTSSLLRSGLTIPMPAGAKRPPVPQRVTVGRIVAVRRFNKGMAGVDASTGQDMAAIVTGVHSAEVVDLTLFPPGSAPIACQQVQQGTSAGEWYWPERA